MLKQIREVNNKESPIHNMQLGLQLTPVSGLSVCSSFKEDVWCYSYILINFQWFVEGHESEVKDCAEEFTKETYLIKVQIKR